MTMKVVADSNLIVAAAVKEHAFHVRATAALAGPRQRGELLLPQHVLIETFSVITRSPPPLRLLPQDAYRLLRENYGSCLIIESSLHDVWQFIRERDTQTAGGAVYDALIAVSAIEAGAQRLLTFNPKHFDAFADRIEIVVPA